MTVDEAFERAIDLLSARVTGQAWEEVLAASAQAEKQTLKVQMIRSAWQLTHGAAPGKLAPSNTILTELYHWGREALVPQPVWARDISVLSEWVDIAALKEVFCALTGSSQDLPDALHAALIPSLIDALFQLLTYLCFRPDLQNEVLGGGLLLQFLLKLESSPLETDDQAAKVLAMINLSRATDHMSKKEKEQLSVLETKLLASMPSK